MLSTLSRMIQQNWLELTVLFAMAAAFMLLRSPGTRVTSTQELDALRLTERLRWSSFTQIFEVRAWWLSPSWMDGRVTCRAMPV